MSGFDPSNGPQFPGAKPEEEKDDDHAYQVGLVAGMLGGSIEDAVVADWALTQSKKRRALLDRVRRKD